MEDNSKEEEILKHISFVRNDLDNEKSSKNKNKRKNKGNHSARISNSGKNNRNKSKSNKKFDFRNMTKKQKIITTVISIILILIIVLGVIFGKYIHNAEGNVAEAVINMATDVLGEKDPIFVLALGISEDISNPLTDTIILGGYNPDSQKAFMVSIPRDTFIGKSEASANGYDKINALYQKDVKKTVKAVENLTGINIDNYVVVRNTVLPDIVDAIGAVEFDVPIDMDYDDPTQDLHIHFEKGPQMIDGEKSELLLRFRHNNDGSSYPYSYGDNDYGRMRTQREFMKKVADNVISLNNVSKTKDIATAVFNNLETDISLSKALSYIPYGLKFNTDSLVMEQLPGSSAMINNLWFYKASKSKTKDLIDKMLVMLELDDKELEKCYTRKINQKVKDEILSESNKVEDDNKDDDNENKVVDQKTCKHEYVEYKREKGAKCTDPGKIYLRCKKCGKEKVVESEPIGHIFDGEKRCKVCGALNPDYVEKDDDKECDHEWKVISEEKATCIKEGKRVSKCTKCGKTKSEKLPMIPHNFVNGICTVCGAKEHPVECDHNWVVESKVDATCTKDGNIHYKCSKCGKEKDEKIKAKGHNFDPNTGKCTNPGCSAIDPNFVKPEVPDKKDPDDSKNTVNKVTTSN